MLCLDGRTLSPHWHATPDAAPTGDLSVDGNQSPSAPDDDHPLTAASLSHRISTIMVMLALFSGEPSPVGVADEAPGGGNAGTRADQRTLISRGCGWALSLALPAKLGEMSGRISADLPPGSAVQRLATERDGCIVLDRSTQGSHWGAGGGGLRLEDALGGT
ncbi:hypothetical protein GCM10029976_028380 [Kribbella albertanoniae]